MSWCRLALLVLAAVLVSCAPPPDEDGAHRRGRTTTAEGETARQGTGSTSPAAAGTSPSARNPGPTAADAVKGSEHPENVLYGSLPGGLPVVRCPGCGEVQKKGASECPGCRTRLRSAGLEVLCGACLGGGRCDHCGDDRLCLLCDGTGKCSLCSGNGCNDCGASRKCTACRGDGWRERVKGDFEEDETWWPGTCASCVDGSGRCHGCAGSGKDAAGADCPNCRGDGACADCAGSGRCFHCGADGDCLPCDGSGRIRFDGHDVPASSVVRTLRLVSGTAVSARPKQRLGNSMEFLKPTEDTVLQLTSAQLSPPSWYQGVRWIGPQTGRSATSSQWSLHYSDLASLAVSAGMWGPAIEEYGRAVAVEPRREPDLAKGIAEAKERRGSDWIARAEAAVRAADTARAARLLLLATSSGVPAVKTRAELLLTQLRKDAEKKGGLASPKDAALLPERAQLRATDRVEFARKLVLDADGMAPDDPRSLRLRRRAVFVAWQARRILGAAAARQGKSEGSSWTREPRELGAESRAAEADALRGLARVEMAGGLFSSAERHARLAVRLAPDDATSAKILAEAEEALARSGVLRGSPPPVPR